MSSGSNWEMPEDYEYSGGEPERVLKIRAKCPHCGHVFEVEMGESWYNMGISITCPKCNNSFSVSSYGEVIGEKQ